MRVRAVVHSAHLFSRAQAGDRLPQGYHRNHDKANLIHEEPVFSAQLPPVSEFGICLGTWNSVHL